MSIAKERTLPAGWVHVSVETLAADEPGALTDGPFGSNLKTGHYTDHGPRVIRLQNIGEGSFIDERAHISEKHFASLHKHEARANDVAIAMLGDKLPRACLVPPTLGPAIVKADCVRLRVNKNLALPQYVSHGLNSEAVRAEANKLVHGVGRPRLGLTLLRTLRFPLAPLEEQHRIVNAIESQLSRLDDAVTTLERVQRHLKRYRASVLKAAVEGRLVPTEAELARAEGRDYEPASRLLERILVERRRRWEEAELTRMRASGKSPKDNTWKAKYEQPSAANLAELPGLPDGWCWTTVGQIGQVSGGLTQNAKRNALSLRRPFLRVANVYANELRLNEIEVIGVEEAEIPRVRLMPGDLLVVEGNGSPEQIGRVALWDGSIPDCLHQNHLIKVRFEPTYLANWTMTWLLSPGGRAQIQRVASSTSGLHTLSISKIAALPVPLCPSAEQDRILEEVDRMLSVGAAAERSVKTSEVRASRLRQSILKWAFQGKLADQDPTDEPASVLLERVRQERAATETSKKPIARRTKKTAKAT